MYLWHLCMRSMGPGQRSVHQKKKKTKKTECFAEYWTRFWSFANARRVLVIAYNKQTRERRVERGRIKRGTKKSASVAVAKGAIGSAIDTTSARGRLRAVGRRSPSDKVAWCITLQSSASGPPSAAPRPSPSVATHAGSSWSHLGSTRQQQVLFFFSFRLVYASSSLSR